MPGAVSPVAGASDTLGAGGVLVWARGSAGPDAAKASCGAMASTSSVASAGAAQPRPAMTAMTAVMARARGKGMNGNCMVRMMREKTSGQPAAPGYCRAAVARGMKKPA